MSCSCQPDPRGPLFTRHADDCPSRPLAGIKDLAAVTVPEAGKTYQREGAVYARDEYIDVAYGGVDVLRVESVTPDPLLGRDVIGFISYSGAPSLPYTTSFVIFEKGGWRV